VLKERENQRLAQEIHDDVGQAIIALQTEVKLGEKPGIAPSFLDSLREQIDQIYTSVYHVLFRLRPKEIEDVGLSDVLMGDKFADLLNKNGIQYYPSIKIDNEPDKDTATELFRICQEAISNIIKHSKATKCTLTLLIGQNKLDLVIEDNGQGFDLTHHKKSHGLDSLNDRTTSIGAVLCIKSNESGTRVHIHK
jgi:two-component system sensor histidine kinase UhpB